jgi:glycosyltransferase involved in cell wall biosynthesis
MKVLIVTGSYPPDICGVGDYIFQLDRAFKNSEFSSSVLKVRDWKLRNIFRIRREILLSGAEIIHIQYPTEGYGYSIVPQLLFMLLGKIKVVTLHEFSSKSLAGKLAIYIFFLFSSKLIFTTLEEYVYALKRAPFIKAKSQVINIGSNISFITSEGIKKYDVVYFGHIRPSKGLEKYIELVEKASLEGKHFKFLIIGQIVSGYESYFDEIKQLGKILNIDMRINIPSDIVALLLSQSKFAYLPYPDGVTRRRGSFIATLGNGCNVITTKGRATPIEFEELCLFAGDCNEAYSYLLKDSFDNLNQGAIERFIECHSWVNIVNNHIKVYNSLAI